MGYSYGLEKLDKVKKIYTKDELIKWNKDRQIKELKKLGAKEIPRLEPDRVKLIMKLQK